MAAQVPVSSFMSVINVFVECAYILRVVSHALTQLCHARQGFTVSGVLVQGAGVGTGLVGS